MIYEKRLLVLGGRGGSGCLRLERTENGVNCRLTGNVRDCVLSLRAGGERMCFGPFGQSSAVFTLPRSVALDGLVAAVGNNDGLTLYGGFVRPLPAREALEEDVRHALRTLNVTPARRIEDYFLDIVPTDYEDDRIAEVNYYRSSLTADEPDRSETAAAIAESTPEPAPPEPKAEPVSEKKAEPERAEEEQPARSAQPAADDGASAVPTPPGPEVFRPEPPDGRAKPVPELHPVSFYESVKDQVERLFAKNARSEDLERLLPESRWVRVDYDASGRYYLVGTIGDPVRYLCYGVPGEYSPTPPADLAGYCQWLAKDPTDPAGAGYWIMYQDGMTGRSLL